MKILSIGRKFEHQDVEEEEFESPRAFLDFDIILFDPAPYIISSLEASRDRQGYLSKKNAMRMLFDLNKRRSELVDFLDHGRPVLTFPYAASPISYMNEHGTIQNPIDTAHWLPWEKAKLDLFTGSNIEFRGDEPVRSFWIATSDLLRYRAVFSEPLGKPLFYIKGTDRIVGCIERVARSYFFHCPSICGDDSFASTADRQLADERFIEAVIKLVNELSRSPAELELPLWHKTFLLPGEREGEKAVRDLQAKRDQLDSDIQQAEGNLHELVSLKVLFTGKDQGLVDAVNNVLTKLDLSVKPGPEGRDDLIATYDDGVFVAEVKGRDKKGAAESDAAQLEKWVSGYHHKHSKEPKGLLIVNGYKNLPLNERTKPVFPDQMLGYCRQKQFCLISGLQLLCLYVDSKDDANKRKAAIEKLFQTVGVFPDYQGKEWKTILS